MFPSLNIPQKSLTLLHHFHQVLQLNYPIIQVCYLHKYLNELKNLSNFAENELFLLASPHKNQQTILLKDLAKNKDFQPTKITLLLGPEGGFSDAELAIAEQANFKNFVLGKRILRTETAGLAIISALQTLWGDFLE